MKKLVLLLTIGVFVLTVSAQKYPGYVLYSVMGTSTTYLKDTTWANYHSWTHSSNDRTGYSSYLMPGGTLWRSIQNSGNVLTGGGMTGRIQKVDWNGNVLWNYTYSSSTYCLHHDICPLPNGNVLVIAYDVKSASEVAAAGGTYNGTMWSEKVMELQPVGTTGANVVWEWKLWDHLVQNVNSSAANYQTSIVNNPQLLNINFAPAKDWVHMNGIDYNPVLDQIALSSHNLNMWWIIDHSTTTAQAASHSGGNSGKGGDLLYRYGNPASYQATGSTVLNVTHDAHWIPEFVPNAGRLVGFNNKGVSSTQSAVDQINVPLNGYNYNITLGQAYAPATYNQRHACNGYSSNMSNSEQFPNGNMLVCMATLGTMYEIGPGGNTLWSRTASGMVPQAHHYTNCFVTQSAPAIPTITNNSGTLTSSSATSYQWYFNGQPISNATNQTYTPTQNGIYLVRITDSNGCVYQYSLGYTFTGTTGIDEQSAPVFKVYPSLTTGLVNISEPAQAGTRFDLFVYDAQGRLLVQNKTLYQLDLTEFGNGIYYIVVKPENNDPVTTKIVLTK